MFAKKNLKIVKLQFENKSLSNCRAAFTFSDNVMGVAAKGVDFAEFKSHFGADDRGFGYIKITVRIRYNSSKI